MTECIVGGTQCIVGESTAWMRMEYKVKSVNIAVNSLYIKMSSKELSVVA